MINFFLKAIAKIINSKLVLKNPYVDLKTLDQKLNNLKILKCLEQVIIGEKSKFYEQAKVDNFQGDKSKIKIGKNSHIRGELLVFANGGQISIGNNSFVGTGSRIWSAEKVEIGNSVLISHNCNIIDTNSHELDYNERNNSFVKMLEKGHPIEKNNIKTAEIIIEDFVWISYNVSILKGVRIGKGAIIGANSLVTKDVPELTLMGGNPAREIKKIQ
ncbi:acyltransferase [Flavobacterium daemonense]|uniref:acyltransferase n=1 Tax=Flavobacterium daemonense TaxID=1393049 RepID=UPI001187265E|nr:acyltransferase [Flavobacterium daemonense]KAF2333127.1 acyltransferase [Flavobacterium daemonense]